ncbi:MAG TPA: hypothetical protein VKM54_13180 [Myxococcota bacterium]|nr:hypothetical protein [Myxococcota bacterium]
MIAEFTLELADPALLHLVESQTLVLEPLGRRAEAEHKRDLPSYCGMRK